MRWVGSMPLHGIDGPCPTSNIFTSDWLMDCPATLPACMC
jgi:hypothetical protein